MASTTPNPSHRRSASRTNPPSRPTTPLRPSSRTSLRDSVHRRSGSTGGHISGPLDALEPAFAELSDGMADLEANFIHLQLMQESLARFSENFAAFLYGMNMNAFCVDFPEQPIPESFKRDVERQHRDLTISTNPKPPNPSGDTDVEATFLTTDTSFVDNPPSSKAPSKFSTPAPSRIGRGVSTRGGPSTRGGTARGGTRGSGLPRGAGRGRGYGR